MCKLYKAQDRVLTQETTQVSDVSLRMSPHDDQRAGHMSPLCSWWLGVTRGDPPQVWSQPPGDPSVNTGVNYGMIGPYSVGFISYILIAKMTQRLKRYH